jgi:uncharacterized repeat protein (TIGR03806 family)
MTTRVANELRLEPKRALRLSLLVAVATAAVAGASCGDDGTGSGGAGSESSSAETTSSSTSTASQSASIASTASSGAGGGEGGAAPTSPTPPPDPEEPWETLAEWNLFSDPVAQAPNARVEPYRVIASLFSDEAEKLRFLYVPDGVAIRYEDEGPWGVPDGAIFVKTFFYPLDARDEGGPRRLMETRLLWRVADDYRTLTYVWNEEQTEAVRKSAGDIVPIEWIDEDGEERGLDYVVPNNNQCRECHQSADELVTLGGRTVQMDLDDGAGNQIDRFAELGFFDADPTPPGDRVHLVDPFGDDDVMLRARSYLHANCAHCHTDGGGAVQSGLLLDLAESDPEVDPINVGICKVPTSAGGATCGLTFDIVPGDPDASVMICRVESVDTEVRMPPLARQLAHGDGVQLLRDFIDALPPSTCE